MFLPVAVFGVQSLNSASRTRTSTHCFPGSGRKSPLLLGNFLIWGFNRPSHAQTGQLPATTGELLRGKTPRCCGGNPSEGHVRTASTLLGGRLGSPESGREREAVDRGLGLGYEDVAHVQPALADCPVPAGGPVGRHVGVVGHSDLPAPGSAGGGEGLSAVHLRAHAGAHLGCAAARLRRALRALPHPPFKRHGGLSPPRLLFHGGLRRRAARRQVVTPARRAVKT